MRDVTVMYEPKATIPDGVKVAYNYLNPNEVCFTLPRGTNLKEFLSNYILDVMNEIDKIVKHENGGM